MAIDTHYAGHAPRRLATVVSASEDSSSERLVCLAADGSEIGVVTPWKAPLGVARGCGPLR